MKTVYATAVFARTIRSNGWPDKVVIDTSDDTEFCASGSRMSRGG